MPRTIDSPYNLCHNHGMVNTVLVQHLVDVITCTLTALLAVQGWRGTVRFTVHIDADAKSVKVVPEVLPVV